MITRDPPRGPKGPRPQYFDDPAIDQLYAAHLAVAAELSVAMDRLDALERLLEHHGQLQRSEIDRYVPEPGAETERAARRAQLVERLLRPFVDYRESLLAHDADARDDDRGGGPAAEP